ncbi:hypothetical protein N0V82_002379 [Gnomoniopsis sp. IMI 355080]|nr:hypothetical protein N0V82_002379 [Gnomoniopsis sp. IMI 355080]
MSSSVDVKGANPAVAEPFQDSEARNENSKATATSVPEEADDLEKYPEYLEYGPKLYAIIISVAIPKITDRFGTLDDVGWYGSAYLLVGCSFQLFFGKLYSLLNVKWVFLTALLIFEVGSLVCAVAPSSMALIIGRAIAGLGSAGIFSGAMIVVANIVSVEKRPVLFGAVGAVYGVASVVGPLMGGAFTDNTHLTWRWCFYINLPLGAVTAILVTVLLHIQHIKPVLGSPAQFIKRLDPIGTIIFVPSIVCLLLALQWGGLTYAWSSGRIIACLVVFALTFIGFWVLQFFLGQNATVPKHIITNRSIAAASFFGLCIGGSFFIFIFYVPIWFQAIKGTSAMTSGVYCLPLVLAEIVAIAVSGGLVTNFGQYAPFFIASSVVSSVGAGLTTLLKVHTSQAAWVGFTFLYGLGIGFGFQQGGVAAQAVLPAADVAVGTTVVMFLQIFGGAVFVSAANNIFDTRLVSNLQNLDISGLNPSEIVALGATGFRSAVSAADLPAVLVAYNEAIVQTFKLGLILTCVSIVGAVLVEWKSVKGKTIVAAAA